MKSSHEMGVVEKSSIFFKIHAAAPQIFSDWKNHMKKIYPHRLFDADMEIIKKDLVSTFSESLTSLFENHKEKIKELDWSIGFIYGFVSSNVTTHWCVKYIYTKTMEYEKLMILKAIMSYLDFDSNVCFFIEKIHKELIKNSKTSCSYHEKEDLNNKMVCIQEITKSEKYDNTDFTECLSKYLESIFLQQHNEIFGKIIEKNRPPELVDFFTDQEIEELIRCYDLSYA